MRLVPAQRAAGAAAQPFALLPLTRSLSVQVQKQRVTDRLQARCRAFVERIQGRVEPRVVFEVDDQKAWNPDRGQRGVIVVDGVLRRLGRKDRRRDLATDVPE